MKQIAFVSAFVQRSAGSRCRELLGHLLLLLVVLSLLWQPGPLPVAAETSAAAELLVPQVPQESVYLSPVADATLDQTDPDATLGLEPDLRLFWLGQNEAARALLRFNLASALPPEAIVDSALLGMYLESSSADGAVEVRAINVLADWTESTVTWNTQPATGGAWDATWVDPSLGQKWLDVTAVVQAWHNQPHYGLLLGSPEGTDAFEYHFASRSSAVEDNRPVLEVNYHLPVTSDEGCSELVANGDFEAGALEAWGSSGTVGLGAGRDGGHAALFDLGDDDGGELWQGVTIPYEAGPVVLEFWWQAEAETEQPGDVLDVIMQYDGGADHVMSLPASEPLGVWRHASLDLSAYGGTQMAVTFLAHSDGEVPTAFRVDDVGLTACGGYLPDLVVTDVWAEGNRICYQMRNEGDYAAPEGHASELLRPEVASLAWDWVEVPLDPGQRLSRCFDYDWACEGDFDGLLVRADAEGVVPEWDNQNNWREEGWQCDTLPPEILSGPGVVDIAARAARVTWETGEPGDSQVFYSTLSRGPGAEAYDGTLVLSHSVPLSGLEPNTVYSYTVTSADEMGNRSERVGGNFQTLSEDDGADPGVSLRDPGLWRGTVNLVADATDNERVEKVAFCLREIVSGREVPVEAPEAEDDFCIVGEILLIDYSPPYEVALDTTEYDNGDYAVEAKVYDGSGRAAMDQMPAQFANPVDPNAPVVTITSPTSGQTVSGKIKITAQLSDDQGLAYVYLWINGGFEEFVPLPSNPKSKTLTFDWDTTVVTKTNTIIAVEALDTKFNKGLATVPVQVSQPSPPLQPKLKVTQHTVTRKKNAIEVALTVTNVGLGTAQEIVVVDSLRSFQPISRKANTPHAIEYEASYVASTKLWQEVISDTVDLAAGASRTYVFTAIPVMVNPGQPSPAVGEMVDFYYEDTAGKALSSSVKAQVTADVGGLSMVDTWSLALKQATYLIVTNPQRLSWYHVDQSPVDDLLSAMAELAYHKDGALGFLYDYNKYRLDALVEPLSIWSWSTYGDNWSGRLHPDFYKVYTGALLIVGESEIVPGWESSFKVGWNPVKYSDQPYADIGGSPAPELMLGRIVGDKATTMIKPIQASIGVHTGATGYANEQLKAMAVSGPGLGTFVKDIDDVSSILYGEGYLVAKVHTKEYFEVTDFGRNYETGDDLAVGEVEALSANEEIVIGDKSADKVYVYDKNGAKLDEFFAGYGGNAFDDGDQVTVASGRIVVADASADRILIYEDNAGWGLAASFAATFDSGDVLDAGDVVGTGQEEIIVADHSANRVEYYTVSGQKLTNYVSVTFDPRDLMAVGDLLVGYDQPGDAKDEIVIGDRSTGKLLFYTGMNVLQASHQLKDATIGSKTLSRLELWDYDLTAGVDVGGSAMAIGELYPYPSGADSGKEELLIAPARNMDHLFPYWWYPAKSELRGAVPIPWQFDGYEGLAIGEMGTYLGRAQDEVLVADSVGYVRIFDTNNWGTRWNSAKPTYFPSTDLLVLSGHGNTDGCCGLSSYSGGTFPINFAGHNPVGIGLSCLTGNYQDKSDTPNFPDRLMDSGMAVYIGATKDSSGYQNREAANWLAKNWDYGEPIGKAFTELERSYWKGNPTSDWWWYWAYEYNLYGDPKFTAKAGSTDTAEPARIELPSAALAIEVPHYVVTRTQGLDWVEIPGGRLDTGPGELLLPIYAVSVDYPAGQRVQDVALVERSGLISDTGLILPMVPVAQPACDCAPEPYSGVVEDWYPQGQYDWELLDNGDGTTTLMVTVYPFYYNPLTTDVRFFQNYLFEVSTEATAVSISGLTTDRGEYEPGEGVVIDLAAVNSGEAQDVIVSAAIKEAGSDEVVAGLPLRVLSGLQGPASVGLAWDSGGAAPGTYLVEVTLIAAQTGQVLDLETRQFEMGITLGQITAFTAAPRFFEVGDVIDFGLTFENAGSVPITGTAVFQVLDGSNQTVVEFQHDINGLQPGAWIPVEDSWDTAPAAEGTYRLVGWVSYGSGSTEPVVATLTTEPNRVYLPLVTRQ